MRFVSKFFLAILVSCFAFWPLSVTKASAKVISVEKGTVTISKTEVINDDLFVAAQTVEISGTINGDVYAGAETIRIDGTINGDLHAGGGMVYLSGKVSQDAYIGAGSVIVSNAVIGDSLLVGAGNVTVDQGSSVGGSVLAGTGSLMIDSPVKRNVFAGAGSVNINSIVGGEVRLGAGSITLGPDTKIAKDLYYTAGEDMKEISISDSATVGGTIKKVDVQLANRQKLKPAMIGLPKIFAAFSLVTNFFSLVGALIVGFLCLKLFSKSFSDSANLATNSFFGSVGVGFLICIAAVPALIILAITGVGLPLAGLLILILLISMYLAKIVVGLALGLWLSGKFGWKSPSIYMVFTVGLITIYLLKMIPFLGFFISLVVLWTGLGALALYSKSRLKN